MQIVFVSEIISWSSANNSVLKIRSFKYLLVAEYLNTKYQYGRWVNIVKSHGNNQQDKNSTIERAVDVSRNETNQMRTESQKMKAFNTQTQQ